MVAVDGMLPGAVELVNKTHQLAPEAMGGEGAEKILILVYYLSFTVTKVHDLESSGSNSCEMCCVSYF